MPPKAAPKKVTPAAKKATAKLVPTKSPSKTSVKGKSSTSNTTVKKADSKLQVSEKKIEKKWTAQDDAARKIQTLVRGFLARRKLKHLKQEKENYEDLMEKLEREACIAIAKQFQKEAEEEAEREAAERRRRNEKKKREKRMLEAAFDGDLDDIKQVLKEVKEADDKAGVGHDIVGLAIRQKNIDNMMDCEDVHGHTPLSEASSGGFADTVKYLIDLGADPNSRGQFERTPLYRAAFAGHADCATVLLQNGADPRLYASDGQTPENVSSQESIKEILQEWDVSHTDTLLNKIEGEKEKKKEMERQRRLQEKSELDQQMEELEKEYEAHQKTLNKFYCELNKRIAEHDEAPAMGFDKPELTLQMIKDAEDQLELAKVDFENTKEKMRMLQMKQNKHQKETLESEGEVLVGLTVTIQELPDIILRDVGNKIKDSGKWPLIIDTTNRAPTFLRYQDTNYINALMPRDVQPNIIRQALLGSIRYGKAFVIDMMEVDMLNTISDIMDTILPGLMNMIIDKSILEEKNYLKLVRESDGPNYSKENFSPMRLARFMMIILSKNVFPSQALIDKTFVIRIHTPE